MPADITDAYALAGAVSLGAMALLYFVVWRAQRRRWCAAFALAYVLTALIFVFEPVTRPGPDRSSPYTALLALPAVLLLIEGMIDYVQLGRRPARWLRAASLGSAVVLFGAIAAGLLSRLGGAVAFGAYMAVIAVMALLAALREPRTGHGLEFLAMMLFPAIVVAAWRGWFPVLLVRYAAIVPIVIIGMTMLTTGLVRAQRRVNDELRRAEQAETELRHVNDSLEQRVALRTAELHDMVAGLEAFNRNVSHDLRGPLGGIAGASRVAAEALHRGDGATAARLLPMIAEQADSSVQLVGALLELARVSEARFAPKRVALEALVQEALAQLRLAGLHDTDMPVTVTTPLPEVDADPDLLRQVYVNLIGNAVKFSREASAPRIEVGVLATNGHRTFYVRDNGVGFDNDSARQLFEPFQRLHGEDFQGHGVGLSIVKRIVERHGGRIWAESTAERGATFYFTLGDRTPA